MTISAVYRADAIGNDAATTYPYLFKIFAATHLDVRVRNIADGSETILVYPTQYTVTGVGVKAGGTVVLADVDGAWQNAADGTLKTGYAISIVRVVPVLQSADIRNQGGFFADTHEDEFDYLTMIDQQQEDAIGRSVKLSPSYDPDDYDMEMPAPLASTAIGWNATADGLSNIVSLSGVAVSAFMATVLDDANAAAARTTLGALSSANGAVLAANLAAGSVTAEKLAASAMGFSMINGTIVASVGTNILTVAIKTKAGADPSATDPVYVLFRNVTPGTGDYTVITLTAATSIATTVGGTFGVANGVPCRLWIVGFNDGGTFRLALINCLTTVAGSGAGRDVTAIYPLSGFGIASATQIGAGSTSASVFYSFGAAVSSKAYATLGYLTYETGVATMGTFTAVPTRLHLRSLNESLPGHVIQTQRNDTGALATGTTAFVNDDTIPQSGEGDQFLSQAITSGSAANVLVAESQMNLNSGTTPSYLVNACYQDATANALGASMSFVAEATRCQMVRVVKAILASTTSVTTFKWRGGMDRAGTTSFNGSAGARIFGGSFNSYGQVQEIMA